MEGLKMNTTNKGKGLPGLLADLLEPTGALKIEPRLDAQDTNVLAFTQDYKSRMFISENAIITHMQNMFATYGETHVREVLEVFLPVVKNVAN